MIDDHLYENIKHDLIQFMSLFYRIFTPIFRNEPNDKYRCNKNQIKAIMIIGRIEKITPTMLGKCMDMEKGSITTLIDSIEKMGLVYRKDDLEDKRKIWIQLTKEGIIYYINQEEKFTSHIKEIFNSLPNEEIKKFSDSLKTIISTLDKVRGE